jgi:hypothetical protein
MNAATPSPPPALEPVRNVFEAPSSRTADRLDMPYSGLGVSSVLIAVLSGLGIFALIGYVAYVQLSDGTPLSDDAPATMAIGLATILCSLLALVGLVLGIAGLFQSGRAKLLPWLGVIFNLLVVLVFGSLVALGIAAT